jgi:hypothetical protein
MSFVQTFASLRLPEGQVDVIRNIDRVMELAFYPTRIRHSEGVREFYDMLKPGPRGSAGSFGLVAVAVNSRIQLP